MREADLACQKAKAGAAFKGRPDKRRKRITVCLASALVIVICGSPVMAHHSYAMFDATREITLKGTVKDWKWTNPHTFMVLVVPGSAGTTEWNLEGQSTGVLRMFGWNREMVKAGDKVTVRINPLRNGASGGQVLEVLAASGRNYGRPPQPK